MNAVKNLKKNKNELIIIALLAAGGLFAALGNSFAGLTDTLNVLDFFDDKTAVAVGSLLLPLLSIFCVCVIKEKRDALITVICAKLLMEILSTPFGINLNVATPLIYSDFEYIFFVAVDAIIFHSLIFKENEKTVSRISFYSVLAVMAFTCVIDLGGDDFYGRLYRMIYLVLIYAAFLVLAYSIEEKEMSVEEAYERSVESGKLSLLYLAASICFFVNIIFITKYSNDVFSFSNLRFFKLVCFTTWIAVCVIFTSLFVSFASKLTLKKAIAFSVCSAVLSVLTISFVNSYIHLIETIARYPDYIHLEFYDFWIYDISYTYGDGWLRYPSVFSIVFLLSMGIVAFINKKNSVNSYDETEEIYDLVSYDDGDFCFVGGEENIISFDFEKKTLTDSEGNPLFDGDSFVMGGTEYDILLTFESKDGKEKFIVYTDNSRNDDDKIRVFASKYSPEINVNKLLPIETEEEWDAVKTLLDCALRGEDIESAADNDAPVGKIDTFNTLCHLADAIAHDESNQYPFMLIAKGQGEKNDLISVIMSADINDATELLKCTVISVANKYKKRGKSVYNTYDELKYLVADSVSRAYKNDSVSDGEYQSPEDEDFYDEDGFFDE